MKLASSQYILLASERYSLQSTSIYSLLVIEKSISVSCLIERNAVALKVFLVFRPTGLLIGSKSRKIFSIQSFCSISWEAGVHFPVGNYDSIL